MALNRLFILCIFLLPKLSESQIKENPILKQWVQTDAQYNDPENGNPILPGYYADPSILENEGSFYIYATSDLTSWNDITKMGVWSSKDLKNWKCQYLNWPTKEQCYSITGKPDGVWAPSVVKGTDGKFYMYVTVGREIWVGVAPSPLGPWKNARADNQPLIRHKSFYYVETIDAECFIDDDGQAYLYWGSSDSGYNIEGRCLVVKLNNDMASFDETPIDVTPPHFFEAPYMLKRNGTYYLMYSWGHTWDKTYQVRYATGETPYGPWEEGLTRPILVGNDQPDRITSTGHHTVLTYQGKDYIVYHRFNTMDNYDVAAKLRQIAIDELSFNDDGGIGHVVSTHKGVPPAITDKTKNLALKAQAKSSSDLDTVCRAAYVNDENNATLWINGASEKAWIQLDFGKEIKAKAVEIYPEFPIYTYPYRIETSIDGENWTVVEDAMDNTKIGSPLVLEKKLNMRYLRVNLSTKEKDPRPGIWEIKVF